MSNVYVRSGAAGAGTGADWNNAYTTLAAALTAKAAGDDFWLSEDHAETQASDMALTAPGTAASPNRIICVNHSGTVPPVSADLRTTATVSITNTNGQLNVSGYAYFYGITFNSGASTNSSTTSFGQGGSAIGAWLDSCAIKLLGNNSGATINLGYSSTAASFVYLTNTTVSFAHASQKINLRGRVVWVRTASAVAGTIPTTLFLAAGSTLAATLYCVGVDFSALGSGHNLIGVATAQPMTFDLIDCELGSSVSVTTGSVAGAGGVSVRLVNCDSADTNYRYYKQTYQGTITQETTIVRTGGATDGTTPVSRKMVSTANSQLYSPLESDWIYFWANTTGSTTVNIYTVTDNVTLKTSDIDVQVEYLGTASFPLGLFATSGVADVLATGSNYSTDTSTWTTTGLGTPVKQVLSVTFTTTGKGLVRARVRLSKASATVYFDPLVLTSSGRQYMAGEQYANEGPAGSAGMLYIPNLDGV